MFGMATTSPAVASRCSSSQQLALGVSQRPLLDSLYRSERDSAMATAVRCFPSGDGDSDLLSDHGERLSPRRCFSVSPVVLLSRRQQCFRRSPSFHSSSNKTVHLRRLGPTSTSSVRLLPVTLAHRSSSPSMTLRLLTFSIASSTFTGSRF
ncbi:hypothetical protein M6B38_238210 [Iris pallida]|uniref:Uncharacterized protein n=1 Tax=Iris pallida TaxID=29817 RepID=A0AAX6DLC4_IRIPA|nr:hypothetical protein M6B38_238210 [Iris pallida]